MDLVHYKNKSHRDGSKAIKSHRRYAGCDSSGHVSRRYAGDGHKSSLTAVHVNPLERVPSERTVVCSTLANEA